MSIVNCPHCQGGVENRADLSEQVVSCPHCRRKFQMPAYSELLIPRAQPLAHPAQQQPSVVMVNTAPRSRARLKPKGWASNTFAVAGVFFTCAMLFVFATCGGFWYWTKYQVTSSVQSMKDNADKIRNKYRDVAAKNLKPLGYSSVSKDTGFVTSGDPDFLTGKCKGKDGTIHDFKIEVKHAEFDGEETWEVIRVLIDGEEV